MIIFHSLALTSIEKNKRQLHFIHKCNYYISSLYIIFSFICCNLTENIIVDLGGGGIKGGNGTKQQQKKVPLGEALFLTTSHLLVLVIKNVCL